MSSARNYFVAAALSLLGSKAALAQQETSADPCPKAATAASVYATAAAEPQAKWNGYHPKAYAVLHEDVGARGEAAVGCDAKVYIGARASNTGAIYGAREEAGSAFVLFGKPDAQKKVDGLLLLPQQYTMNAPAGEALSRQLLHVDKDRLALGVGAVATRNLGPLRADIGVTAGGAQGQGGTNGGYISAGAAAHLAGIDAGVQAVRDQSVVGIGRDTRRAYAQYGTTIGWAGINAGVEAAHVSGASERSVRSAHLGLTAALGGGWHLGANVAAVRSSAPLVPINIQVSTREALTYAWDHRSTLVPILKSETQSPAFKNDLSAYGKQVGAIAEAAFANVVPQNLSQDVRGIGSLNQLVPTLQTAFANVTARNVAQDFKSVVDNPVVRDGASNLVKDDILNTSPMRRFVIDFALKEAGAKSVQDLLPTNLNDFGSQSHKIATLKLDYVSPSNKLAAWIEAGIDRAEYRLADGAALTVGHWNAAKVGPYSARHLIPVARAGMSLSF